MYALACPLASRSTGPAITRHPITRHLITRIPRTLTPCLRTAIHRQRFHPHPSTSNSPLLRRQRHRRNPRESGITAPIRRPITPTSENVREVGNAFPPSHRLADCAECHDQIPITPILPAAGAVDGGGVHDYPDRAERDGAARHGQEFRSVPGERCRMQAVRPQSIRRDNGKSNGHRQRHEECGGRRSGRCAGRRCDGRTRQCRGRCGHGITGGKPCRRQRRRILWSRPAAALRQRLPPMHVCEGRTRSGLGAADIGTAPGIKPASKQYGTAASTSRPSATPAPRRVALNALM